MHFILVKYYIGVFKWSDIVKCQKMASHQPLPEPLVQTAGNSTELNHFVLPLQKILPKGENKFRDGTELLQLSMRNKSNTVQFQKYFAI